MANFNFITRDRSDPKGKSRVYISCHPQDHPLYFQQICGDIFKTHDCVIYYSDEQDPDNDDPNQDVALESINLFVFPVSKRLLTSDCRAMQTDLPFARNRHIPILPIMMETGLDELYAQPDHFGPLQYLTPCAGDGTEMAYADKLRRFLDSVLISAATAARIRKAFDAYIFLSYRKKDRRHANELMRIIHSDPVCRDIAIWFDEFLTPGEDFQKNIDKILSDSKLFALVVTPNLLEEPNGKPNFVMRTEYPAARRSDMDILPARMEPTDDQQLRDKFSRLPACLDIRDPQARQRLLQTIGRFARQEDHRDPGHNFLIGLAYLNGIDMEVDRPRGSELIHGAAQAGLPEAMATLICMYTDGDGVAADEEKAQYWSQQLAAHFFRQIFGAALQLQDPHVLAQLFSQYKNPYYAQVIRFFLLEADARLDTDTLEALFVWLTGSGISEYTLLLDTCRQMTRNKALAEHILVADILHKSTNGTYPPYGPLFWYIPEYELFGVLLHTLKNLTQPLQLARALALCRDVCFLFGQKNTAEEICPELDLAAVYRSAETQLTGVRRALCRIFYLGDSDAGDMAVYPRCFSPREAAALLTDGHGLFGRVSTPFEDELGLYSHEMFPRLNGEHIGLSACPYDRNGAGKILRSAACSKLRGLILSPTDDTVMGYIPFHRTSVRVLYIPENITESTLDFRLHMPLQLGVACNNDGIVYFRDKVVLTATDQIPDGMFRNFPQLTEISLCPGITAIGAYAFEDCAGLKRIDLPRSVSAIGAYAFAGCTALCAVTLPEGLTAIENAVFYRCEQLATLALPESLERIGHSAFENCPSLRNIRIPDGVTFLGTYAFSCSGIEEVVIPRGIRQIPVHAFSGCSLLTHPVLHDDIERIDPYAFNGSGVTRLELPKGLKVIDEWAFQECASLEHITFPQGLERIATGAFSHCPQLRELYIPDSVTEIGHRCFYWNQLEKVTLPGRFRDWLTEMRLLDCEIQFYGEIPPAEDPLSALFDAPEETQEAAPPPPANKCLVIPEGTTEITQGQFRGDQTLLQIILPDSVTRIGPEAFAYCRNLQQVRLPKKLEAVGTDAFLFCTQLQALELPETLTGPENAAFHCCGITEIRIPAGWKAIGDRLFSHCFDLKDIHIPDSVESIGWSAFSSCDQLQRVRWPEGLRLIGDEAFERCPIAEIRFPAHLEQIGSRAFSRCKQLTSLHFPPRLAVIGDEAFACCDTLAEVEIPATVRHIGQDAFADCRNLKRVRISANFREDMDRIFAGCPLESIIFT